MKDHELPEKEFIHEEFKKNPFPMWLWAFIVTVIFLFIWTAKEWLPESVSKVFINKNEERGAFNHVTNREFSIFLWQNDAFMRKNMRKSGYLPAFQVIDKDTVEPEIADQFVVAPPEILFRYHVWSRLIGDHWYPRRILVNEFKEFLAYCEEWQPQYWNAAPSGYVDLVHNLQDRDYDLRDLSENSLPLNVRAAFQGWKNYTKEAKQVYEWPVTQETMQQFLTAFPHYQRTYWQNILNADQPNYLKDHSLSNKEMSAFLKVAFYNYYKSLSESIELLQSLPDR